MLIRRAAVTLLLFTAACASERPSLTATDAQNPDAPTAQTTASTALVIEDGGAMHQAAGQHDAHAQHQQAATTPDAHARHQQAATTPDAGAVNAAAYSCPMHPEVTDSSASRCPKCGMKLEKQTGESKVETPPAKKEAPKEKKAAAAYACPMHPEVTDSSASRCPKCNMKLEPVKK